MVCQPQQPPLHPFRRFADAAMRLLGSPTGFWVAVLVMLVRAAGKLIYGYSDTWRIVMNSITAILTLFFIVLMQSARNRNVKALNVKLDELIRARAGARNRMIGLERQPDAAVAQAAGESHRIWADG